MIKNSPRKSSLLLLVPLVSVGLIFLAIYAQTNLQGPLNVPGDIDFMIFVPGKYTLYRESIIDSQNKTTPFPNDAGLNEILLSTIHGRGHLSTLQIGTWNNGVGMPYYLKDAGSGSIRVGMPFADFEILWPGSYHLHVEFSSAIDKHPNIMIGPTGLITIAIAISILAQIIALFIYIDIPKAITRKSRGIEEPEIEKAIHF